MLCQNGLISHTNVSVKLNTASWNATAPKMAKKSWSAAALRVAPVSPPNKYPFGGILSGIIKTIYASKKISISLSWRRSLCLSEGKNHSHPFSFAGFCSKFPWLPALCSCCFEKGPQIRRWSQSYPPPHLRGYSPWTPRVSSTYGLCLCRLQQGCR